MEHYAPPFAIANQTLRSVFLTSEKMGGKEPDVRWNDSRTCTGTIA